MFDREIRHEGLNKAKIITGKSWWLVQAKAAQQMQTWEEEWRRRQAAERDRQAERDKRERERQAREGERARSRTQAENERQAKLDQKQREQEAKEAKKQEATDRTSAAQDRIAMLRATLARGLDSARPLEWGSLKDTTPFPRPEPQPPAAPAAPTKPVLPPPPAQPDPGPEPQYRQPQLHELRLGVLDEMISSRRQQKIAETAANNRRLVENAKTQHEALLSQWRQRCAKLEVEWHRSVAAHEEAGRRAQLNWRQAVAEHQQKLAELQEAHGRGLAQWTAERAAYDEQLAVANSGVDDLQAAFLAAEPAAVEQYCELALEQCQSGEPQDCEASFAFQGDTGVLVVDYNLMNQDALPRLKEVKYVQSRDEFVESELSERELTKLYDDLLYQIALRTVYELYVADTGEDIKSIVFNGWVTSVDRSTGKQVTACIMSFQSTRQAFLEINFGEVEPKACFRSLKGIGSAQLHSLTPVAPVLSIDREDPRFISSYAVAASLAEGDNLAAMDWEDFEHLIREVFEEEFSVNGGEVKVTQASRDGGVDAVAFDPDPIRGGKIVIQAKRYTNVVGVSAVRDLYGTVINEGATKGILITTANYGSDAHEFAQGKPLVLLSGNHLLHLLEKHGHKARIDLKEAKQVLADREKEESG